jgi:hypothetical protein
MITTINIVQAMMPSISYGQGSKFLTPCETAIRKELAALDAGTPIRLRFPSGGYNGTVVVSIDRYDDGQFSAKWSSSDPSRFPARLKAAATALYNCACFGDFELSHRANTLEIRRIVGAQVKTEGPVADGL